MKGQFSLLKVDGGTDIDVMKSMKVDALPTFIIYRNGKEMWRKQGMVELTELKQKISSYNMIDPILIKNRPNNL